ncbi:MAG TPA: acyltransferase family protein [Sphingopyxis sp.]|nr:acyltransferase family protein [Sphingopyxis sp.]HMP45842.1 acyltransferase family protein [Sphingopyxis sp.]HMQ18280.1 acyltransferase family protein [Sphingopyxis sp.]
MAKLHSAAPSGAFFYMDAMRALFALAVAFAHLWALLIRDYQPTSNLLVQAAYFAAGFGHQAVILFFVLSGYWITGSVARNAARGWSWRGYLIDRLSRLLIVLVPVLILGGILDAAGLFVLQSPTHLDQTGAYVMRKDVAADLSPLVLLGNLAFLQFIVPAFGTNGPLWSLSYEFWFYIWFPTFWLLIRRRQLSLGILSLAFAWFVPALALGFLIWLCGSAAYGLTGWARRTFKPGRIESAALLAVTAAALLAWLLFARFSVGTWKDPVLALLFALFLLALIVVNPRPLGLLRPAAAYGAGASFSLYATHFPVMAFAVALSIGAERLAPGAAAIGLVAAIMLGSLAIAWLFARHTEARTPQLRRWLNSIVPPPIAGYAQAKAVAAPRSEPE